MSEQVTMISAGPSAVLTYQGWWPRCRALPEEVWLPLGPWDSMAIPGQGGDQRWPHHNWAGHWGFLGKWLIPGLNQGKLKMSLNHLGRKQKIPFFLGKKGNDQRTLGAHRKNSSQLERAPTGQIWDNWSTEIIKLCYTPLNEIGTYKKLNRKKRKLFCKVQCQLTIVERWWN